MSLVLSPVVLFELHCERVSVFGIEEENNGANRRQVRGGQSDDPGCTGHVFNESIRAVEDYRPTRDVRMLDPHPSIVSVWNGC